MKGVAPVWAVLVQQTAEELRQLMRDELEWSDGRIADLEFVMGSDGYTGVVSFEPGSENGPDLELAHAASAHSRRIVYHLLLNRDFAGSRSVSSYEGGERVGTVDESPWRFAANKGLSLDLSGGRDDYQACLVALGNRDEVVAVLASPAALERYQIEETESGLAIYGGDSVLLAGLLRSKLPDRTLYTVSVEHAPLNFCLKIYRTGGEVETFEHPPRSSDPIAELLSQNLPAGSFEAAAPPSTSVLGETKPLAILRKIGLDPARLGLE